jgi:hypothetical protein
LRRRFTRFLRRLRQLACRFFHRRRSCRRRRRRRWLIPRGFRRRRRGFRRLGFLNILASLSRCRLRLSHLRLRLLLGVRLRRRVVFCKRLLGLFRNLSQNFLRPIKRRQCFQLRRFRTRSI